MFKKYRIKGRIYSSSPCTLDDIPSHIEKVSSFWNPDEIETQRKRMEEAVYCGTAYKGVDVETGEVAIFLYYEQLDDVDTAAIAFWFVNKDLLAMGIMWMRQYTFMQFLHFKPHTPEPTYLSLVEDSSVRNYHKDGTPLTGNLFSKKLEQYVKRYENLQVEEIE